MAGATRPSHASAISTLPRQGRHDEVDRDTAPRASFDSSTLAAPSPEAPLPPFLELTHISKRFGGVVALQDVDLTLEAGEVHCLVGENGSGKSTLIKIISGVQPPEPGGRIVIEGQDFAHLDPVRSTASGIQVIYQDLSLFPNLSVAENIAIGR